MRVRMDWHSAFALLFQTEHTFLLLQAIETSLFSEHTAVFPASTCPECIIVVLLPFAYTHNNYHKTYYP